MPINDLWYKSTVVYCLDVEKYQDADGDGVGDFEGLTRRLDYLQGLGDYLRGHPEAAGRSGELKKQLAERFPDDIDSYVLGKTDFVLEILRRVGLTAEQIDKIERQSPPVMIGGASAPPGSRDCGLHFG